jgi:hypothetical protein
MADYVPETYCAGDILRGYLSLVLDGDVDSVLSLFGKGTLNGKSMYLVPTSIMSGLIAIKEEKDRVSRSRARLREFQNNSELIDKLYIPDADCASRGVFEEKLKAHREALEKAH